MKIAALHVALAALTLGACASAPTVALPAFDASAAQRLLAPGSNTIRGNAFQRQSGGGVVTCAGREVTLVPATAYAQHVFQAIYGSAGDQARHPGIQPHLSGTSPEFGNAVRKTLCDSQGNFTFERVADGEFFVETTVTWVVSGFTEGGPIMRRVSVAGAQQLAIVIAP